MTKRGYRNRRNNEISRCQCFARHARVIPAMLRSGVGGLPGPEPAKPGEFVGLRAKKTLAGKNSVSRRQSDIPQSSFPTLGLGGRGPWRDPLAFVYILHSWRFVRARWRFRADLSKVFFFAELFLVCLGRLGDHIYHFGFIFLAHGICYFFLGGGGGRCGTVNPFPGKLGSGRGCGDGWVGWGGCEVVMG